MKPIFRLQYIILGNEAAVKIFSPHLENKTYETKVEIVYLGQIHIRYAFDVDPINSIANVSGLLNDFFERSIPSWELRNSSFPSRMQGWISEECTDEVISMFEETGALYGISNLFLHGVTLEHISINNYFIQNSVMASIKFLDEYKNRHSYNVSVYEPQLETSNLWQSKAVIKIHDKNIFLKISDSCSFRSFIRIYNAVYKIIFDQIRSQWSYFKHYDMPMMQSPFVEVGLGHKLANLQQGILDEISQKHLKEKLGDKYVEKNNVQK